MTETMEAASLSAYRTIMIEREALDALGEALQGPGLRAAFDASVKAIAGLSSGGRLIVTGMGKSGIIARKIAATMSSLGTPALFVHSTEAMHGDLGQVGSGDVAVLISGSGETKEVVQLIPFLRRNGSPIVVITCQLGSTLAKHADVVLDGAVERESCALNLAPTTSTLVALALGDALAIAVAEARGFRAADFARFHPGGKLGERLLAPVSQLMHRTNLPLVPADASLREVAGAITDGGIGVALVLNGETLAGVITDGDMRRAVAAGQDFAAVTAEAVMSRNPRTIRPDVPMFEAEARMREAKITAFVVTDEGGVVLGVVQIHD